MNNNLKRFLICGLVILFSIMLVSSGAVAPKPGSEPGPKPPEKKYQYQTDLKNARDHMKDAKDKIRHDLRLLEEGIMTDDIQKKKDARRSIMEAVAMLDDAIEDFENAKTSAMNEMTKDRKLARFLNTMDSYISMAKTLKVKCLKIIPMINQMIMWEMDMDQYPPDMQAQIKRAEMMMLEDIKDMMKGK